ncbi:hypothetical protein DPMN_062062 [Dreissena polymorpha]|uniref:Uncharacterized protein n=1 Tax=Dreissena polymorpha TaxID=45954 RepID=A0A9D4C8J7_DREPO|nr:hypothetical protein DPMN_062062 [Dreissena polymorpha]
MSSNCFQYAVKWLQLHLVTAIVDMGSNGTAVRQPHLLAHANTGLAPTTIVTCSLVSDLPGRILPALNAESTMPM